MADQKPRSNAETILEAIQDMHAAEQIVTRETLADHTGLRLTVVDDRLSYLVNNGRIHRVQRGVFVPAEQHRPARHISRTLLPDGTTVLDIGDQVIHLTPREARMLGETMAGAAQSYAAVEIGHQTAQLNSQLRAEIQDLRRQLRQIAATKNFPAGSF